MADSEFIVKLKGIKLPDAVEERIAGEIQAVVLRELARMDTGGTGSTKGGAKAAATSAGGNRVFIIPPEWRGMIVARYAKNLFGDRVPNYAAKEIDAQGKVIG
jgi:hypothetical protein